MLTLDNSSRKLFRFLSCSESVRNQIPHSYHRQWLAGTGCQCQVRWSSLLSRPAGGLTRPRLSSCGTPDQEKASRKRFDYYYHRHRRGTHSSRIPRPRPSQPSQTPGISGRSDLGLWRLPVKDEKKLISIHPRFEICIHRYQYYSLYLYS